MGWGQGKVWSVIHDPVINHMAPKKGFCENMGTVLGS